MDRSQGYYKTSPNAQDDPPTANNFVIQNVNIAEVLKL